MYNSLSQAKSRPISELAMPSVCSTFFLSSFLRFTISFFEEILLLDWIIVLNSFFSFRRPASYFKFKQYLFPEPPKHLLSWRFLN